MIRTQSWLQVAGKILLSLLLVLLTVQLIQTLFPKNRRGDLGLVVDAATRLRNHQPLYYDSEYLPHTKSPLATLAFVPLSFVATPVLDRVWDLGILVSIWALCRWCLVNAGVSWGLIFCALLTAFNPLNSEIAFGQFNLLMLLSALWATSARSPGGRLLGGAAFAFSICFKPTQILLLPWVWKFSESKKLLTLGAVTIASTLAILYIAFFGWEQLYADHLVWWTKTAAITPYHLGRPDNYGLPSSVFIWGLPGKTWGLFQLSGLFVAIWVCAVRARDRRFEALALSCVLVIVCSPMAWLHVYVLSFPFVVLLWRDFAKGRAGGNSVILCAAALVAYYWGTEVFNPTAEKLSAVRWMFFFKPPLVGILLSLAFWSVGRKAWRL